MAYDIAPRSKQRLTYEDALLYCFFLEHNGLTGWHLPTPEDLKRANISRNVWSTDTFPYEPSSTINKKLVQPFRITGDHKDEL